MRTAAVTGRTCPFPRPRATRRGARARRADPARRARALGWPARQRLAAVRRVVLRRAAGFRRAVVLRAVDLRAVDLRAVERLADVPLPARVRTAFAASSKSFWIALPSLVLSRWSARSPFWRSRYAAFELRF